MSRANSTAGLWKGQCVDEGKESKRRVSCDLSRRRRETPEGTLGGQGPQRQGHDPRGGGVQGVPSLHWPLPSCPLLSGMLSAC